jgi:hypothetical protein
MIDYITLTINKYVILCVMRSGLKSSNVAYVE